MHKIKTLTDLRKELQLERYDRKNTKVFVKTATGTALRITGIELATDVGVDAGKMALFISVENDDAIDVEDVDEPPLAIDLYHGELETLTDEQVLKGRNRIYMP